MAETEFARAERLFREVCELERQLALERERAKVLVEALENLSNHMPVVSVEYMLGYTDTVIHPAKEALAKYRGSA